MSDHTTTVTQQPGGKVDREMLCVTCGYNLFGLDAEGRCPECATPVGQSRFGNMLRYADPEWVSSLRRGITYMLWYILISVVVAIIAAILGAVGVPTAWSILPAGLSELFALWATWLITAQEPRTSLHDQGMSLRKLIRGCAVLNFIGSVMVQAAENINISGLLPVIGGILALIGLMSTIGFYLYLRRFAKRMPNPSLALQAGIVMWGSAISFGLLIIVGLGAAIFALSAGAATTGGTNVNFTTRGPGATTVVNNMQVPTVLLVVGGIVGGLGGLGAVVFGLWSIFVLFGFRRAFAETEVLARAHASGKAQADHPQPISEG